MSCEKAIHTITEMMKDRGYHKKSDDELIYENEKNNHIKIFFCMQSKVNIEMMKKYINELNLCNVYHSIIIYSQTITSSAKKILEHIVKFCFETFHIDELQYNITKHVLYSPHEKIEYKDKLNKKIPIIFKTDPVCRYFNFDKGNVIKIIRKNGMIVYRIVR